MRMFSFLIEFFLCLTIGFCCFWTVAYAADKGFFDIYDVVRLCLLIIVANAIGYTAGLKDAPR